MSKCFEIKGNRLVFLNNGEDYIDDDEKKKISGSFTEIEFPPCFDQLYHDDFKYCKRQLANVTKLDFSKATKIETIDDRTFTGAKSLKVVVLPKKVTSINEFQECPNLKEIHIYKLEDLYSITKDEDKRLTVYASRVSQDIDSFSDGFLADVGILYVPKNSVRKLEKARDEYDDELDIRPLPDGYSFPTEALSEPWGTSEVTSTHQNEETKNCSHCETNLQAAEGSYELVLVKAGREKLKLVKEVKDSFNWGLKEAKDWVENAPSTLTGISKTKAENAKKALEGVGATVKINGSQQAAQTATKQSSATIVSTSKAEPATGERKPISLNDIYGEPQYHCVLAGQSFGPVTVRQFANMARFGIVDRNTLVWKDGMPNWAYAMTVADLQTLV